MLLLTLLAITTAHAAPAADRALAQAIERRDEPAARHWLEHGADPEYRGADPFGSPLLLRAVLGGEPRLVRLLIQNGARADARDRRGTPILVNAAAMARGLRADTITRAIAELLAWKADPNIADQADLGDDRTALHAAASIDNLELARLLLRNGADPNRANRFGETPLFFAAERGHGDLVAELVSRGASARLRSRYTGMTPLGLAAERGHAEIVRLLLKHRANPASRNAFGKTPIDLARQAWAAARNPAAAQALAALEDARLRQMMRGTSGVAGGPADSRRF